MKKLFSYFLFCLVLLTPVFCFAVTLPTERYTLYKAGSPISNFASIVFSCDKEDSDGFGGYFHTNYCGYFGEMSVGKATIYQVTNNQADKIYNPSPFYSPPSDYLVKLNQYYAKLVKTATKSKTIDIKSPDGIRATSSDRYYSVDVDTGEVRYISNDPNTSLLEKVGPVHLIIGFFAVVILVAIIFTVRLKFWKRK